MKKTARDFSNMRSQSTPEWSDAESGGVDAVSGIKSVGEQVMVEKVLNSSFRCAMVFFV